MSIMLCFFFLYFLQVSSTARVEQSGAMQRLCRRIANGGSAPSQTDAPRERKSKDNSSFLTCCIHRRIHRPKRNKTNMQACRVCGRDCNSEDPVNKKKKLRWDYMKQIRLCLLTHLEIVAGKQCHYCTKVFFLFVDLCVN